MHIYKYQIKGPPTLMRTHLRIPKEAQVVHVGSQNGDIFIWAEVKAEDPPAERCFYFYGTGHNIVRENYATPNQND